MTGLGRGGEGGTRRWLGMGAWWGKGRSGMTVGLCQQLAAVAPVAAGPERTQAVRDVRAGVNDERRCRRGGVGRGRGRRGDRPW